MYINVIIPPRCICKRACAATEAASNCQTVAQIGGATAGEAIADACSTSDDAPDAALKPP
eukprot:5008711-Pyramimonas_sp.AAC.1